MKYRFILFFLVFSACQNADQTTAIRKYFDSKTWVESLIADLEARHPRVEKTWIYDHQTEKEEVSDINWQKELKLFLDADLNKSSFIMSYDSVNKPHETTYRLKPGENLPVKELTVAFDTISREPVSISCVKQSENYFFTTGSQISLSARAGKLAGYEIRSVQRLLWFKPDSSYVSGKVLH
ncbi:MAG: hypothetical protein KF870_06875 [Leadbetterella sp.]|nr:hypothetical protein [Leadbetterella sp.]